MIIDPLPTVDLPAFQMIILTDIELITNEGLLAGPGITGSLQQMTT